MLALLMLPIALQAMAMVVDEGWFHRRRGLPRWERLGHPLDTLTIAVCLGWLVVGPRNIIREQVTMHCGSAAGRGVTIVGADGFFMVGVHIGHDCIVGDQVTMANSATLGGHVVLEDHVIMGGLSAAHQYIRIGRHAFVGGMAGVNHDVIPFGNVWGNHAHLEGLNLVGLKRRGFSRDAINTLRAAYRMLFAEEGTFQERLEDTAEVYAGSPEVMEIVSFIRADSNRPLTTPQREV